MYSAKHEINATEMKGGYGIAQHFLSCEHTLYHFDTELGRVFWQRQTEIVDVTRTAIKSRRELKAKTVNATAWLPLDYPFLTKMSIWGEVALNVGFERNEVAVSTGNPAVMKETQSYQYGLLVGQSKAGELEK